MLDATNVLIHWHPVLIALIDHGRGICPGITHEVPRRIHKGIHGVSLTPRRFTALRACHIQKVRTLIEGIATAVGNAVLWQYDRQIFFWDRDGTATRISLITTMNNRNGRTPIALP